MLPEDILKVLKKKDNSLIAPGQYLTFCDEDSEQIYVFADDVIDIRRTDEEEIDFWSISTRNNSYKDCTDVLFITVH